MSIEQEAFFKSKKVTHTPEKSSEEEFNCNECSNPDSYEDMVECEKCKNWFHYSCVGVTSDIGKQSWACQRCKRPPSRMSIRSNAHGVSHSIMTRKSNASNRSLALELEKLEMERTLEHTRLEEEQTQNEKRIQEERALLEKEYVLKQAERIRKEKCDKEYLDKRYSLLQKNIAESVYGSGHGSVYADSNANVIDDVGEWVSAHSIPISTKELKKNTVGFQPIVNSSTAHIGPKVVSVQNIPLQSTDVSRSVKNFSSVLVDGGRQNIQKNPHQNFQTFTKYDIPPSNRNNTTWSYGNPNNMSTYIPRNNNVNTQQRMELGQYDNTTNNNCSVLSTPQLVSRQGLSKELPYFSGRPEEWPLFISRYETSTRVCGFSNDENLLRLQKSLKSDALEAVRSRLMLPSSVPYVINTLRRLYGKPEIIIHTLIQKMRSEPAPKIEKLESLVKFSLTVENICAVMEASNLTCHLTNPVLLQELTDKLPSQIKIDWARYITNIPKFTLSTFSAWLNELSESLSQVTMNIPTTTSDTKKTFTKDKNFVYAHVEEATEDDNGRKINRHKTGKKNCCLCNQQCLSVGNCKKFRTLSLDEKWKAVIKYRLCRTCLNSNERLKCKSDSKCGKNGCTYRHNPLLHNDSKEQDRNPQTLHEKEISIEDNQISSNLYSCTTYQLNHHTILFRIIPVILYGENSKVKTFAFLDEGSSLTLMEQTLADELGLSGVSEPLCLRWTANTHRIEEDSQRINLGVSSINCINSNYANHSISNARTVRSLNLPTQTLSTEDLFEKYKYLKGLPINSYENAVSRILIGLDNSKLGASLKIREGDQNEPVAVKTRLGWNVYGPLQNNVGIKLKNEFNGFHVCECERSCDEIVQQMVKEYISLDGLGVTQPIKSCLSKEDERCMQIMKSTTQKIGNRFETGLLWKYDEIWLPDSFPMAKRRLECLEKKMLREPELAITLNQKIIEYEKKGFIHKLSKDELKISNSRIWYLPIFTVTNPNKPGKTRMVWDAAAKVHGVSLNLMLLKGPDQLASLPAVLQRFRERKIAICGDIREMFHQVRIKSEDIHSQRFLWRNNSSDEPDIYAMDVMTFGASCSPSCAQYVKNINAAEFVENYPRAVRAISENHYVDDFLDSLDTEEEIIQLANDVKFIHQQGGFEIRNWLSNSQKVLLALGEKTVETNKDLNVDLELGTEKVLGMWWSTSSDTFTYSLKYNKMNEDILNGKRCPTKREILRILMKLYDPLGLIANFLIYLKILLQDVWKSLIDWDDKISFEQQKKWLAWVRVLPQVEQIQIRRCYTLNTSINKQDIHLHIFVDASENAYAAVAYFRIGDVGAKTRVAPIKMLSIPRLELQAALLGSRLGKTIEASHSIKISKRYFWSDSKTVLSWLNSDQRKFRQFVAFRIGEILETTDVHEWRWISTKENVADEATKWQKVPDFDSNSRWFTGPLFLRLPKDQWPKCYLPVTTNEEVRPHLHHRFNVISNLIQVDRFSKWLRLVRAVAFVYRFIHNIKSNKDKVEKLYGPLLQKEYVQAENHLYRQAQYECFEEEIILLTNNKLLSDDKKLFIKKSSQIYNQSPYLDEYGVLRVRGRIDAAVGIDNNTKRPILLLRTHYITQLIIRAFHEKYRHHNHETVTNEIRQIYSISSLRVALKNECKRCQLCKNRNVAPRIPEMAELPLARLSSFTRPFSYIGVDYFGPIQVSVGRRLEKRWGVLITCLTIRAVYIEIAHTLSTDSCILSIRNFIARRGTPVEIYSDNGTNFHGAEREIQTAMENVNKSKLAEEFTTSKTKWVFIPPAAPHMGGSWERLVQSVKKTLYQIMPTRNPSDELLKSMLVEVENIVNSRPLTYVPIDGESDEALTPNHFLLGSSSGAKPMGEFNNDCEVLKKNWMTSQKYANEFWKRWVREYLPTLTRRTKWHQPVKPIEKDDIVIIVDEKSPRNTWQKGKILDVKKSKDGQVRRATVQTSTGIYERPAIKLAILDVRTSTMGKPIKDVIVIPRGNVTASDGPDT